MKRSAVKPAAQSHAPFVPIRTKRWGAILKLGTVIRACPLDSFEEYPR
jgi:hypothetical protein